MANKTIELVAYIYYIFPSMVDLCSLEKNYDRILVFSGLNNFS